MYVLIVGYGNKIKKLVNIIFFCISIALVTISLYKCLEIHFTNKVISNVQEDLNGVEYGSFGDLGEIFKKSVNHNELEKYSEKYGSIEYGKQAYSLNNLRICSMSFCIFALWLGIAVKKKNLKLGNFIKYISIVVFIMFQLIPLGYDIYVKYSDSTNEENSYNVTDYEKQNEYEYDSNRLVTIKEEY